MKRLVQVTLLLMAAAFIIPGFVPVEPESQLTEAEKEGMTLMREEEKMARDVYLTLGEQWDLVPFDHISKSEQQHMDRMKELLDSFDLKDPIEGTNDERGKFQNTGLAALYDELVQKGAESKVAALRAGAQVEEIDIRDLVNLLAATENADITMVYQNLLRASHNHLRAFTRHLSMEGETYDPVVLDEETYSGIVEGDHQGMHGQGNGNGPGNGGGQHGRHGAEKGNSGGPQGNNGMCNGSCMKNGSNSSN